MTVYDERVRDKMIHTATKYTVNDYVSYASTGVCLVKNIKPVTPEVDMLYYHLQPLLEQKSMAYVPVKLESTRLRELITQDEVFKLLDSVPQLNEVSFHSEKATDMDYKKEMNLNNCEAWLRVAKTARRRVSENVRLKRKNVTDEKYYSVALRLLCSELSVVLGKTEEEAKDYVESCI